MLQRYHASDFINILYEDLGFNENNAEVDAKNIKEAFPIDKELTPGSTISFEHKGGCDTFYVIFGNKPKDIEDSVIVHEMYHAMKRVCEYLGVNDEETSAYMQEYLYDTFKKMLSNYFKKLPVKAKSKKTSREKKK